MKSTPYYALKRRETGKWLSGNGYSITEVNEPSPLRRISTARQHRLRAMTQKVNLGIIDIHKIMVTVDVLEQVENNENIQRLLIDLIIATKTMQSRYSARIPEYVSFCEDMMNEKTENQKMRYLAVFLHFDDVSKLPDGIPPVTQMKKLANFVRKGGVFLINSDNDLAILKLCDGFKPTFIYDFENSVLLLP